MKKNEYEEIIDLIVDEQGENTRIDKYISTVLDSFSRSRIQKLIQEELVLVNNNIIKSNYQLKINDTVRIYIPYPKELSLQAENIPLDIIYEDNDLIIVNKPKGMVVHPSAGHYSGTLVNALLYHCKDNLSGINGISRPGIVHRIDMDTTGLLVICKNDESHISLSKQLKEHTITREYFALCYNSFHDEDGVINAPIGRHPVERKKMAINYKNGKDAITHYHVIKNFQKYSFIKCILETGRTHQIRVHMASISHPLLGDQVYCNAKCPYNIQGQSLHAGKLGFIHPRTNEYMEFSAPLPEYFTKILNLIK